MKTVLLALLLAGCAAAPPRQPPAPPPADQAAVNARALLDRAALLPAHRAASLYLQAAWVFAEAGDAPGAQEAFAVLEPGWLSPEELVGYQLLVAKMALDQGDVQAAQAALDRIPESAPETPRRALIASQVCARQGDYGCALSGLVRHAGDDPGHNERIWGWLSRDASLARLQEEPPDPPLLRDWRALHTSLITATSVAQGRARAAAWLARHPEHPAALIPPDAVRAFLSYQPAPLRVSLLLPLSGPLARAGEAVRDGFIAAVLRANALQWLNLTLYDTAAEPVPAIYERLLADRTDLIVGPLQKASVTTLNGLNPDVPALVLNYLDPEAPPAEALRQVGLAIEDEAATISRRLGREGLARVLLFHNYDDWSLRARRVLADQALEQGGPALTIQPLTDVRTITEAVGDAMHVANSTARRDELAAALGIPLEFLPRAREDLDAIVALIDNGEANALVPALRFHFGSHLPVYASSQVVRNARPGQLASLEGFHVSELPWFLGDDPVRASMAGAFHLAGNPYASLVALGSDAYRLAERVTLAGSTADLPLLGSTGLLKPQPDGRLRRELPWGIITAHGVRPESGAGH